MPDDQKEIFQADYAAIELRVLAHLNRELGDIHLLTASDLYGVPPNEVTSDQRRIAKILNFGVIYGILPFDATCHKCDEDFQAKEE